MHNSSEMKAIFDAGVTSIQSLPVIMATYKSHFNIPPKRNIMRMSNDVIEFGLHVKKAKKRSSNFSKPKDLDIF